MSEVNQAALSALFDPQHVAVIGASGDPNKIGGRPIAFLKKGGFVGTILPVNPKSSEVQGLQAYPSVGAIPVDIDCAIIALPSRLVDGALTDALAKGAKAVIVFSSGFGETGADGDRLQKELADKASEAGAVLLGPNSLGAFSTRTGLFSTFATALDHAWPEPDKVSIATQSGAFGSYCLALLHERGIGVGRFAATGNEAQLNVADLAEFLADDPETGLIVLAIEGAKDGRRLTRAISKARSAGKPVLVIKTGVSEAGQTAAATHTGSLGGSSVIFDASITQAGGVIVRSFDELVDACYVLSIAPQFSPDKLGVITTSGGVGVYLADAVQEYDFQLPTLGADAVEKIRAVTPFAAGANPVDTSAQILSDMSLFGQMHDVLIEQGGFDTIIVFLAHVARNEDHFGAIREALIDARTRNPDKLFVLCMLSTAEQRKELEAHGFVIFAEPNRAVRSLRFLANFAAGAEPLNAEPESKSSQLIGSLNEFDSAKMLKDAGVPVVTLEIADDPDAVAEAASKVGYPCVVKILSPDILHKSDIGGVKVGIMDDAEAVSAATEMLSRAQELHPEAKLDGFLVAEMANGGIEAVLGSTLDPVFGPVVMFGLGGVSLEVFKDVVFLPAPISAAQAENMIRSIDAIELLEGYRGQSAVDISALAKVVSDFSEYVSAHRESIQSIDVNPLLISDERIVALDAVVVGAS